MKVDKKANFLIFLIIAILALGLSNFAAAFTGDLVLGSFPGINDTDKMIALDDDNFSPASLNTVYEPKKVVEEVNDTDNSTDNSTDHDDGTDDKPNDNSDNQNSNSDSNNNGNDGDDSDSKPKPTPSDDSSDDE
ncbi:MAG: hypothetical protein MJ235_01550 [archaeon]|nr:hypothetical protein [archaeon]